MQARECANAKLRIRTQASATSRDPLLGETKDTHRDLRTSRHEQNISGVRGGVRPETSDDKHQVRDGAKCLEASMEARSHGTRTAKTTDGLGRRATIGKWNKNPERSRFAAAPCDIEGGHTERCVQTCRGAVLPLNKCGLPTPNLRKRYTRKKWKPEFNFWQS